MVALRLVQKLKNVVSRSSGFSALPRRWSSSQTCVIRGTSQDVTFPITMFQSLADHEAQFPLVTKIPHGGLILVDPTRPSLINEHWRRILFSGFLHSHICKLEKDCIVNAFDYTNVGVLKELNLLAFKKFDRVEGKTNCDHKEYSAFVEDLFNRFCGLSSLQRQFQECEDFVDACKRGLDEEVLRYHSFFLEDEELANLYSDKHRLLRQEFKHRLRGPKARKILTDLNGCYSNTKVVRYCENHILLQHLLGSHKPVPTTQALQQGGRPVPTTQALQQGGHPVPTTQALQQGGRPVPMTQALPQGGPVPGFPGTALVDVHRIAVQHAIEDNVLTPAFRMYPQESKLLNNYSRVDLIRTLRYMFPKYPGKALFLFKAEGVLNYLQMARRLPTPSIYHYVSPPVSGHLVSTEKQI